MIVVFICTFLLKKKSFQQKTIGKKIKRI